MLIAINKLCIILLSNIYIDTYYIYQIPSRVTQFDGEIPRSQFMLIIVLMPFSCCKGK